MKNNLDNIAIFCESEGIYAIEGVLDKRTIYVTGGGDVGIIQTDGKIRIPLDMMPEFLRELQEIAEDYRERIHAERILKPISRTGRGRRKIDIDTDAMVLDLLRGMKLRNVAEKYQVSLSYVTKKKKEYTELGLL